MINSRGFRDTGNGFQMTFANGYTVSVQWNYGCYCDNRHEGFHGDTGRVASTAEVAFWHGSDGLIEIPGEDDTVAGWKTADEVAAFITNVAAMAPPVARQIEDQSGF